MRFSANGALVVEISWLVSWVVIAAAAAVVVVIRSVVTGSVSVGGVISALWTGLAVVIVALRTDRRRRLILCTEDGLILVLLRC